MALLKLRKRTRQPSIPNIRAPLVVKPRSNSAHDLLRFGRDVPLEREASDGEADDGDESDSAQLLPNLDKRNRFAKLKGAQTSVFRALTSEKGKIFGGKPKEEPPRTTLSQSHLDMITRTRDDQYGANNDMPRSLSAVNIQIDLDYEHPDDCLVLPAISFCQREPEPQRRMSASFSMEALSSELKRISSRRRSYETRAADPTSTAKPKFKQPLPFFK